MSSGRYINYASYADISTKTNIILGLKKRILEITHETFKKPAIARLKNILADNGYPNRLLQNLLNTDHYPIIREEREEENQDPEASIKFGSLPYIRELTPELLKLLRPHVNMKIGKYNMVTNRQFFKTSQDKIDKNKRKNIVYKINCRHCPLTYIGQTSQSLGRRMTLHRSDSRLRPERCALARHVNSTDHQMDYESVEILDQESNYNKRIFLEMCYIKENNAMNDRSDTNNLSSIYSFLLTCDRKLSSAATASTSTV
ncbi:uncharacterized protein LOC123313571 [Coccinella septempunctata]|uniref:uncharacterized protein LOC123313571 n=1 Tax=Coccinella septempunctata TaxID=41139 RepID=UPI001D06E368|nr:uncharacterized protein LOC123313571 [Coccinella septempunctata]